MAGVGGNQFLIADDNGTNHYYAGPGGAVPDAEIDHGGISGCAVFLFDNLYMHGRLGGFLYAASAGAHAEMLVHHADLISADGSIRTG